MKYYYIYKKKQMKDLLKVNGENKKEVLTLPLSSGVIKETELEKALEIVSTYEGVGIEELDGRLALNGRRFNINVSISINDYTQDEEEGENKATYSTSNHLHSINTVVKLAPQRKLKKEEEPKFFFIKVLNTIEVDLNYQTFPEDLYVKPMVLAYFPVYDRSNSLIYALAEELANNHYLSVGTTAHLGYDYPDARSQYTLFEVYQETYHNLHGGELYNYKQAQVLSQLSFLLVLSPVISLKDFESQLLIDASRI